MQVLIVARVPLIREGLRALAAAEADVEVTALDPKTGHILDRVLAARPEVLLLDVEVLEDTGWALLQELHQLAPGIGVIVVTEEPADQRVHPALSLGARGYLPRDASPEQVTSAIRAVAQGLHVLSPESTDVLLEQTRPFPAGPSGAVQPDSADDETSQELIEPLSPREIQVLQLMVHGLSNKQIAAQLSITEHTVKFHIRAILGKLGASNRTEAVTSALQKGLVSL